MKRRRKKLMVIIPVAVVCVAGAGTVGYFKVAHTKPVQNVTVQAQSAEAKKGNLSKTIVGTGNLELAEAEDQDAPSGLEISEVMVESGDEVKEGDVLAVVDESSILEAMEQVPVGAYTAGRMNFQLVVPDEGRYFGTLYIWETETRQYWCTILAQPAYYVYARQQTAQILKEGFFCSHSTPESDERAI